MAVATATCLLGWGLAQAKGPSKPGGGGVTYRLVMLDEGEGMAKDIQPLGAAREVVGISYTDQSARYWLLDNSGEIVSWTDLPTLPVEPGEVARAGAMDINGSGVIAGWQALVDVYDSLRPVIWKDLVSLPLELDVPADFVGIAQAAAVNDDLLVVGHLTGGPWRHSIVAWQLAEIDGELVVLDSLVIATGDQAGLAQLNNQGYVAATLDYRAYRWRVTWNSELEKLEVTSTVRLFDVYSLVADINEAGTVCGQVGGGGNSQPFAITLGGDLLDFPLLVDSGQKGSVNLKAEAINDAPTVQVVGAADVFSKRTGGYLGFPQVLWNTGVNAIELPISHMSTGIYALDDGGWAVGHFAGGAPFVLVPGN